MKTMPANSTKGPRPWNNRPKGSYSGGKPCANNQTEPDFKVKNARDIMGAGRGGVAISRENWYT
jgi:hypothetical protein